MCCWLERSMQLKRQSVDLQYIQEKDERKGLSDFSMV